MSVEILPEMNVIASPSSDNVTTSSAPSNHSKSLSHLPKRPPVDIEFSDITYTVPTATGKFHERLYNISVILK